MASAERPVDEPFAGPAQQKQAADMGLWIFLGTETMLFGGLFFGFFVYRYSYAQGFAEAARHLDLLLGAVNTALLLSSSFVVACAVVAARLRRPTATALLLLATAALGAAFLAVKGYEYHQEISRGLAPFLEQPFRYPGAHRAAAALFYNFYFAMTGLHALHLGLGILVLLGVAGATASGMLTAHMPRRVMAAGLYWHFVDVVWVFLFPVLYLIDRGAP